MCVISVIYTKVRKYRIKTKEIVSYLITNEISFKNGIKPATYIKTAEGQGASSAGFAGPLSILRFHPKPRRIIHYCGGTPVYTSPAPDLQPEQAAPERACGLRNASFDPGRALERGAEGEFGLRMTEFDPGRPSGRALGLGNARFDPATAYGVALWIEKRPGKNARPHHYKHFNTKPQNQIISITYCAYLVIGLSALSRTSRFTTKTSPLFASAGTVNSVVHPFALLTLRALASPA